MLHVLTHTMKPTPLVEVRGVPLSLWPQEWFLLNWVVIWVVQFVFLQTFAVFMV